MSWKKDNLRKYYTISKWHLLSYIQEHKRVSYDELRDYFDFNKLEANTRIMRLLGGGWVKRVARKTNSFELGKRAIKFLDDYHLHSFLQDADPKRPQTHYNPYLQTSKEHTKKLKKHWLPFF